MKKHAFAIFFISLLLLSAVFSACGKSSSSAPPRAERIIHACGEIDGSSMTNSLEALENARDKGQRFIEIDFRFTSDGELACTHDFASGKIESLGEFKSSLAGGKYTRLTLDMLGELLPQRSGAGGDFSEIYVVTDIKDDNIAGAKKIAESFPKLRGRFIIQIYSKDEYEAIKELGFDNIIYTVYADEWENKIDTAAILSFADGHPLYGITYPKEMDEYVPGYTDALLEGTTPLYVHTVNDEAEIEEWARRGVGVYSDKTD